MTVTVLKTYFKKKKPIQINYRSYKYVTESEYRIDLQENLLKHNKETMDYDQRRSHDFQLGRGGGASTRTI